MRASRYVKATAAAIVWAACATTSQTGGLGDDPLDGPVASGIAHTRVTADTSPPAPSDDPVATVAARRGGDLLVEASPRAPTRTTPSRLRTHVEGGLSAGSERVWTGRPVPAHVKLVEGTRELWILDPVAAGPDDRGGHLAMYRDPYDAGSCSLRTSVNCATLARRYDAQGAVVWELDLGAVLSRPDHLEVQDIQLVDDVLYLNEACQSYAREAGGRCSSLVAVDPTAGAVLWRSRPRISNQTFVVLDRHIVTTYGFTDERDYLSIVRRSDGHVAHRARLERSATALGWDASAGEVLIHDSDGRSYRFALHGLDSDRPRAQLVSRRGGPRR
jgi:hypothetical protein